MKIGIFGRKWAVGIWTKGAGLTEGSRKKQRRRKSLMIPDMKSSRKKRPMTPS